MKHFDVIGYHDEDGGSYCTDHAPDDTSRPVFAGDEGADEHHCDECIAEAVRVRDSIESPYRAVTYLEESSIEARRVTSVPRSGQTRSGYGGRLPTAWQLRIGGRWYRVRIMCWSNTGSAYVERGGKRLFLGAYDPNHDDQTPLVDARSQHIA